MITNQRQFPFKREFFIHMRWIFASEVCSRISLIFFCTWIYTCKTLNFLKFTVPPSSTDIQYTMSLFVKMFNGERVLTSIEIPQRNVYHCILYSRCNFYTCDRNEEKPLYIFFKNMGQIQCWYICSCSAMGHLLVFKMQGTRNISTSVLVRHRLPFWIITVCRYVIWDWSYLIHIM